MLFALLSVLLLAGWAFGRVGWRFLMIRVGRLGVVLIMVFEEVGGFYGLFFIIYFTLETAYRGSRGSLKHLFMFGNRATRSDTWHMPIFTIPKRHARSRGLLSSWPAHAFACWRPLHQRRGMLAVPYVAEHART